MKRTPLKAPLKSAIKDMQKAHEAAQKKLKASFKKEVEKIYKQNKKRPSVEADNAKANDLSYYLFAKALGKIGKPSDTQTVAEKIRLTNKNAKQLAKRNPKRFMQLMYSSASYLVKEGLLTRKKLGHLYYEYSLKVWSKKSKTKKVTKPTKLKQKIAA